jgi:hypothetical protein
LELLELVVVEPVGEGFSVDEALLPAAQPATRAAASKAKKAAEKLTRVFEVMVYP